ncbi:amino-acid acetyltransferase [Thraustotheca clavata]|uniref:Dynein light chain 1, cytoplasmic n=1 Tax=Thraustotheca clavata TaxID=74557 RepID=A0A1V9ZJG4_9STRA|nr:amino-acid acetyltransferase [Thraustotheca clavata]
MPSIAASKRYLPAAATSLSEWHSLQNESASNVNAANVVLSIRKHLQIDGVFGFTSFLSTMKQLGGGTQELSKPSLRRLFTNHNFKISDIEIRSLVLFLNVDANGSVPVATLRDLIMGKLEGVRLDLVTRAFQKLDTRERGYVAVEDILRAHDASNHPSLMFTKSNATQIQSEFVKALTVLSPLCTLVNLAQWIEYFQCASATIDKDDYFELILTRVWHVLPPNNNIEMTQTPSRPAVKSATKTLLSDLSSKNLLATALDFKPVAKPIEYTSPSIVYSNVTTTCPDDANKVARKTSRNATLNSVQAAACMMHAYTDRNGLLPKPKDVTVGTKMILSRLRASLKARGASGIVGLSRKFRLMDEDGNGSLDLNEFKQAMRESKVECSDADLRLLFEAFDTDDSHTIEFKEFLDGVREPMNERRLQLVHEAFRKLDKNGDGVVDPSDIVGTYDASKHPDVIAGKRTQDEIFREFLDTFDVDTKDGKVTLEEWEHYYHNISAVIDSDDYFELMMRNAWRLSGGQGWSSSSFENNNFRGTSWNPDDINNPAPVTFQTPKRYGNASNGATACLNIESTSTLTSTTPVDLQHPRELRRIVRRLKNTLKARGAHGFTGLSRSFRLMDTNGSGTLDKNEFRAALDHLSLHLSSNDVTTLFDYFDTDGSGSIDLNEFCRGVRDPMNERRMVFVRMAFDLMDVDKNHVITVEDVYQRYDAKKNPEVISGRKTEREVYTEFLETFESTSRVHDGRVTLEEWTEYYSNISASIDDDDYFELMMRNAWHISGGEGWCANSTNKRVLVNDNQVVEIENDLGMKTSEIQEHLEKKLGGKQKVSFYDVLDHSVRPIERVTRVRPNNNCSVGAATCLSMEKSPVVDKNKVKSQQPKVNISMAPVGVRPILARLKSHLKLRPTNGYISLHRAFRRMDADQNGHLSMQEFKQALANFDISEVDARILFNYFDLDHNGTVETQEFVTGLRDPMNARRLQLVRQAFMLMDKDGNGVLEPADIVEAYDARKHPDVIAGRKTPDTVFREFLDTFDVDGVHNAQITPLMWEHYYANISAVIEDDDYFELMMRNAWHISGGEGWCANTSNRRVLVNDTQVVEIENDLGVKSTGVRQRLEQQIASKSHMNLPGTIKTLNSMNVTACLNYMNDSPTPAAQNTTPPKRVSLQAIHSATMQAQAPPPLPRFLSNEPDQLEGLWGALRHALRKQGKLAIVQCRREIFATGKSITAVQLQTALTKVGLPISISVVHTLIDDARNRIMTQNKWDAGDITTPKAPTSVVWNHLSLPMDGAVVRMAKGIFAQLQMEGKGDVTALLLAKSYDAPSHPQVVLGLAKADDTFTEFASCFDVDATGHITYEAIETYCSDLLTFVGDTTHCLQILRDSFHMMQRFLRVPQYVARRGYTRAYSSVLDVLPEVPPECLKAQTPADENPPELNSFTEMFRSMSPYINVHRGTKVVIHLCGALIESSNFASTMQDIALLNSFGIHIILVAGSRKQINDRLQARNITNVIHKGWRVTDHNILTCAMEAAGSVRFLIESALGRGIVNAPGDKHTINILSGNFILAQPLGVRGGVDYKFTGEVRRVNDTKMLRALSNGDIVLLSNIGYSASGEVFNCSSEQIAAKCAIQLGCDKLIFMHDGEELIDVRTNKVVQSLLLRQAQQYVELAAYDKSINPSFLVYLKHAMKACSSGVKRAHLVSRHKNGGLLQELFSRDGDGLMLSKDLYEGVRMARTNDIPSIMRLIQPLLDQDILVSRSQEQIESNVHMFTVVERDGAIIACAAMHPYENNFAEMNCVAVDPVYRKLGKGNALLGYILRKSLAMGVKKLFVLTTRTSHWFMERGFVEASVDDLPASKQEKIDRSRQSKVYMMDIRWSAFVAENIVLSEYKQEIIASFGLDKYRLAYSTLSSGACASIAYGYLVHGHDKGPIVRSFAKKFPLPVFAIQALGLAGMFSLALPKLQIPLSLEALESATTSAMDKKMTFTVQCPVDFKAGKIDFHEITRYPMLFAFGFASLGTSLGASYMSLRILAGFPIVMAVVGGLHQDRIRLRSGELTPEEYEKTSLIPFVSLIKDGGLEKVQVPWVNVCLGTMIALLLARRRAVALRALKKATKLTLQIHSKNQTKILMSSSSVKPVVKNSTMDQDLLDEVIWVAQAAIESEVNEQHIAAKIKKHFELKYHGMLWHCCVGRNMACYVTHEQSKFLYFYIGQMAIRTNMEVASLAPTSAIGSRTRAKIKSLLVLNSLAPLPLIQAHHESIKEHEGTKAEFGEQLPHIIHQLIANSTEGSVIGSEVKSRELSRVMSDFERRFWRKANKHAQLHLLYRSPKRDAKSTPIEVAADPQGLGFDSYFESGNLERAYRVLNRNYTYLFQCTKSREDTTDIGDNLSLLPCTVDQEYDLFCDNDTYTLGHIQWYYFKVILPPDHGRLRVRFNIRNMMKRDSLYNCGMLPAVYSESKAAKDQVGWCHAGEEAFYYQNADVYTRMRKGIRQRLPHYSLTFVYEFDETENVVYFAHCFPYTYTHLQTYLTSLEKCPIRSKNLRRRTLCSTLCGNPCDMVTITEFTSEPQVLKQRTGVVLTARVHPGETNGSFVLHGIMEFLTGASPEAILLRKCYIFKIIPMLNPDGVIHGNYRCSLAGIDLNRRWSQPSEFYHPTIYAAKKIISIMRQSRRVLLFCDFHGHSRKKNMFTYGCKPYYSWCRLEDAKVRLFPYILCKTSSAQEGGYFSFLDCTFNVTRSKRSTGRVTVWSDIQILNSITLEASFCGTGENKSRHATSQSKFSQNSRHFRIEDFYSSGEQFCHALTRYGQLLGLQPIDASTLNNGTEKSITENVLEIMDLDVDIPIDPIVRDPKLLTSTTEYGNNDFSYSEAAISMLEEIANLVPVEIDGNITESENSSGSDSNPSDDNYEPEVLEANKLWQNFRQHIIQQRSLDQMETPTPLGASRHLSLVCKRKPKGKKSRRGSSTGAAQKGKLDALATQVVSEISIPNEPISRTPRKAPLSERQLEKVSATPRAAAQTPRRLPPTMTYPKPVKNAGGFTQLHKTMIQRRIHQAQLVLNKTSPNLPV